MNLKSNLRFAGLLISAVTLGVSGAVHAQNWPDKTVRVIVPFGPGGGTDIQGRLLGKKFYESMGQTFVVDNRAGAAGLIGAELTVKSPAELHRFVHHGVALRQRHALQEVDHL